MECICRLDVAHNLLPSGQIHVIAKHIFLTLAIDKIQALETRKALVPFGYVATKECT